MRIEEDLSGNVHMHATCRYSTLGFYDYILALKEITEAKLKKVKTLNFHLPYEIQFKTYKNTERGFRFITFVNLIASISNVAVVWENSNILNTKDWSVIENPDFIPTKISLCFDLGHFILGCKTQKEAIEKIDNFFVTHGAYIKHLHLHINDFISDKHWYKQEKVRTFLGTRRFSSMTKGRTYIFEVSS